MGTRQPVVRARPILPPSSRESAARARRAALGHATPSPSCGSPERPPGPLPRPRPHSPVAGSAAKAAGAGAGLQGQRVRTAAALSPALALHFLRPRPAS